MKKNIFRMIAIFATLSVVAACNEGKVPTQHTQESSASQAELKPSQTDIHTVVVTNNMDALKQYIAAGGDLNKKDPIGGSSPLITAALFDKKEMAKALIDAGADINFRNKDGSTPLITASFLCRPAIVKMLLDKGADKTIKNTYNNTAYESVVSPYSEVKNTYDMIGKMLAPMGLKLDFQYIEKTRPEIAAMLK